MPEMVSPSGQSLGGTPGTGLMTPDLVTKQNAYKHRFGLVCARVGSSHAVRLGVDTSYARAGAIAQMQVEDLTRAPLEVQERVRWVCRVLHPTFYGGLRGQPCEHCAGKEVRTKRELLAAHPQHADLLAAQEVHLYFAVYESPPEPARAAVEASTHARAGRTVRVEAQPARPAQPGRCAIYADEE